MQSSPSRLARNHSRRIPGRAVSSSRATPATASIARVDRVDASGRVLVRLADTAEPVVARLIEGINRARLFNTTGAGREVLVFLDGGRMEKPVIVGLLELETAEAVTVHSTGHKPETAAGSRQERVLIEALAELVLKCGTGSITLRKDGKIILRGTHLLSRSSGPIRIKGGHVEIN
jgi:hypothetical protein